MIWLSKRYRLSLKILAQIKEITYFCTQLPGEFSSAEINVWQRVVKLREHCCLWVILKLGCYCLGFFGKRWKSLCDLCHSVLQFKWSFMLCACSQTVEEEALIKNNNTCKDFLIEAMKYHLLPLDQRQLIKNPRTKPRTPVSLPKVRWVCCFLSPHTVTGGTFCLWKELAFLHLTNSTIILWSVLLPLLVLPVPTEDT